MSKFISRILTLLVVLNSVILCQKSSTLSLNLKPKPLLFGLSHNVVAEEPEVSLVLSGGGARAISQVGFLRAIEELNIPVEYIIGTSMGSIIGGLYSVGYSIDEIDSIVYNAPWNDFFSLDETERREQFYDQKITNDKALFAIRLDGFKPILPTSFSAGQKVSNVLTVLSLNAPVHINGSFNDLRYKFRAVCTDLISGNLVVLENGSLSQAMRASSSVMLLLSPVRKDTLLLVDGGLVANIPVEVAKDLNSDLIITSNTTSPLYNAEELSLPWNIADQIVSIPMQKINNLQLKDADVIVEPGLVDIKNNDFDKIKMIISEGYKAANSKKEQILESFKEKFFKNIENDEITYNNFNLVNSPGFYDDSLRAKLKGLNSISNKELIFELYKIYQNGNIKDISLSITQDSAGTSFELDVKENPIVEEIIFDGFTFINEEQLNNIFESIKHKPYNPGKTVKKILEVLQIYRANGISLADIKAASFDEATGKLNIKLVENVISEIKVEGNEKTNVSVITREFPISVKEPFNINKIRAGLTNLKATDLFESVDIRIEKALDKNILKIIVVEKISSLLRFGLRIDNENLTQASLDIRDENIFGTGTEFGGIISGGSRTRSFILEHRANRLFNTYLTYKIRGYHTFNDVNVYRDDSTGSDKISNRSKFAEYRQVYTGFSVGIGAQMEKLGNLFIEGRYESNEIKNKFDYPDQNLFKDNLAALRFSLSVDSQNKYPYPTKGSRLTTYYETSQSIFGAKIAYTKLFFDYKGYLTIGSNHTIAPRFTIGFADETLPLTQQFSFGGQFNFFGLRDNEFRGRQIFLTSLEYQWNLPFDLFFGTYFKIRYDLGSIWSQREQIRFKDLRHGIGTTLSFDTPIGPADFSVGKSFLFLNTQPKNIIRRGPVYFYFTIGYYY
jgi:NTE family protein